MPPKSGVFLTDKTCFHLLTRCFTWASLGAENVFGIKVFRHNIALNIELSLPTQSLKILPEYDSFWYCATNCDLFRQSELKLHFVEGTSNFH